jgi:hypothetical protein
VQADCGSSLCRVELELELERGALVNPDEVLAQLPFRRPTGIEARAIGAAQTCGFVESLSGPEWRLLGRRHGFAIGTGPL